jgi:hypothetical protein
MPRCRVDSYASSNNPPFTALQIRPVHLMPVEAKQLVSGEMACCLEPQFGDIYIIRQTRKKDNQAHAGSVSVASRL